MHQNNVFRLSGKITLCVFLLLSFNMSAKGLHFPKDPKSSFKSTKLKEIEYFEDLPHGNYTIGYGYDETGRKIIPLAVYDKTFPNFANKRQILRLFLASIGVGDFNLQKLIFKIKEKRIDKKKDALEEHFLKDFIIGQKEDPKRLIFSDKWWKNPQIKWRKECEADLNTEAPTKIPLNCISTKRTSLKSRIARRVQKLLKKTLFDEDSWAEVQTGSFFVRQDDGKYELILSKDTEVAPTKIIDLKGYNSSYKKALAWTIQTNVVKVGIGQIPFAVVPQIVVSILERFFGYIELVQIYKQSEALTMIVEAKNGNKSSPFYGRLSDKDYHHSIQYIKRGSVFFSDIIKNAIHTKEKLSTRYLEKAKKKADKNFEYLKRKGYNIQRLGESYALCSKRDEQGEIDELKIYSLLKRKTLRKKPHAVVDFLKPKREYIKRNLLETILVASNFVYVAIPVIPALVKTAFKEIAIREMQRYQGQEAGFRSYLDYNKEQVKNFFIKKVGLTAKKAQEYIESAYKIIKLRSLNPMILSQQQRERRKIQSELWIQAQNPHYKAL